MCFENKIKIISLVFITLSSVVLSAQGVWGYSLFKEKNKYGLKDSAGKEIIPPKYDRIFFSSVVDLAGQKYHSTLKKYCFLKFKKDELILPKRLNCNRCFESLILVMVCLDKKCGFINFVGTEIIPVEYKYKWIEENADTIKLVNKVWFLRKPVYAEQPLMSIEGIR